MPLWRVHLRLQLGCHVPDKAAIRILQPINHISGSPCDVTPTLCLGHAGTC
jgi:hypothetical protein